MKNIRNVLNWAEDKSLLHIDNSQRQLAKVLEEVGETAGAFVKKEGLQVVDGVGDIFVTVIIISKQMELMFNLEKALEYSPPNKCDELTYLFNISGEISKISDRINTNTHEYAGFAIVEIIRNLRGFCDLIEHDLEYCLDHAYNEIKNRTGKLKDGVFVKD